MNGIKNIIIKLILVFFISIYSEPVSSKIPVYSDIRYIMQKQINLINGFLNNLFLFPKGKKLKSKAYNFNIFSYSDDGLTLLATFPISVFPLPDGKLYPPCTFFKPGSSTVSEHFKNNDIRFLGICKNKADLPEYYSSLKIKKSFVSSLWSPEFITTGSVSSKGGYFIFNLSNCIFSTETLKVVRCIKRSKKFAGIDEIVKKMPKCITFFNDLTLIERYITEDMKIYYHYKNYGRFVEYDAKTDKEKILSERVLDIFRLPEDLYVGLIRLNTDECEFRDLTHNKRIGKFKFKEHYVTISVSVRAGFFAEIPSEYDNIIYIRSLKTGKLINIIKQPLLRKIGGHVLRLVQVSASGRYIAVQTNRSYMYLYDLKKGELVWQSRKVHFIPNNYSAFIHNEKYMIVHTPQYTRLVFLE